MAQGSRALGVVIPQRWGRQADETELVKAAGDLLAEADDDRLVTYLRIFSERSFPLDPAPLLPLVRNANTRIAAAAFTALSLVADPRVRALALDVLADDSLTGFHRGRAADLLVRNVGPGDAALLTRLLSTRQHKDELHGLGIGLLELLAANSSPDVEPALLAIYEYDPCSLCRERAIERLHEFNTLPKWLVEECRYDASLNLRRQWIPGA